MKINVLLASINVKKINTMRKFMNMPDVKVVRFDNKDVIVTSFDGPHNVQGHSEEGYEGGYVQGRSSIWED